MSQLPASRDPLDRFMRRQRRRVRQRLKGSATPVYARDLARRWAEHVENEQLRVDLGKYGKQVLPREEYEEISRS